MKMRKFYALVFAFMLSASLTNAVSAQDKDLQKRLDAVINEAIKNEKIVGATMVVAEDGKVIYRRTAGYNDREAKQKLQESGVFRLASLSKLIVSVTALALVDEGKLKLDDPVTKFIPFFRPKLADGREPVITVRHLLTHTAGLTYTGFEKPDGAYHRLKVSNGSDDSDVSLEENVRRIAAAPLLYEPGTGWNYSMAIDVLGLVLEKAAGKSLQEVVREKVTQPLGMKDTAFYAANPDKLVVPYGDAAARPVRMTEPFELKYGEGTLVYSPARALDKNAYPSSGAGMVGTINDYLKLLEVLRKVGAPILKTETAKLVAENAIGETNINAAPTPTGWGWTLGASYLKDPIAAKTPQSIGTWTWSGAYGHSYFVDPSRKLSVICLTDTAVAGMTGDFPNALIKAIYNKN